MALVLLLILLPIAGTYSLPFTTHPVPMPKWFQTVGPELRKNTRLLVFPSPDAPGAQSMAWQAEDHLHFQLIGGYLLVPGPTGHVQYSSAFVQSEQTLDALSSGLGVPPAANDGGAITEMRKSLQQWGVDLVVVTNRTANLEGSLTFMHEVIGRSPHRQDGAWIWNLRRGH